MQIIDIHAHVFPDPIARKDVGVCRSINSQSIHDTLHASVL